MKHFEIRNWLAIPFVPHGRTRGGCDCWGLVRLFYKEVLDLDVPAYDKPVKDIKNLRDVGREMTPKAKGVLWRETDRPIFGDMLTFGASASFYHVGIYLDADIMLHTRFGTDSTTERWNSPVWRPRFQGFYRLKSRLNT